ncbi:NAD kinase, partial [Kipferlia bialata]
AIHMSASQVPDSVIVTRKAGQPVKLSWDSPPKNALVIKKPNDPRAKEVFRKVVDYLENERGVTVTVDPAVAAEEGNLNTYEAGDDLFNLVDFVVTVGGDGTLLHVSHLFPRGVPPILAFNVGSLGFLTPFAVKDYRQALDHVIKGNFYVTLRARLECKVHKEGQFIRESFHVMNEVVVDRGYSSYLSNLQCYCDGKLVTTVQGDGIILATSTGGCI